MGTKETMRKLSEQSQTAMRKSVDSMEAARENVAERIAKLKEKLAEKLPSRKPTHPELKAVRG